MRSPRGAAVPVPRSVSQYVQRVVVQVARETGRPVREVAQESFALTLALAAGRAGCVLALEPNRYAFDILAANARLNPDATRIEPRCCAATPPPGRR